MGNYVEAARLQPDDRSPRCDGQGQAGNPAKAPASPPRKLADHSDNELLAIVRAELRASAVRAAACELLVTRYRHLVYSCVRRYLSSPEPAEDLMQSGYVGLLSAINNFDPAYGGTLAAYALPCISGELKRHFRDKRWQVHVERPLQEMVLEIRRATPMLTQRLGHEPSDAELAAHLNCTPSDIRQARQAARILAGVSSLDAPVLGRDDGSVLSDMLGREDAGFEHTLEMESVAAHWEELPRREQRILMLRFYSDMTQRQIGQQLGLSQMHVCRLLAHALSFLRERVLDTDPEHPSTTCTA
jgi:RNA polymerase sigma-B factor